jgi:hypothetical protein
VGKNVYRKGFDVGGVDCVDGGVAVVVGRCGASCANMDLLQTLM